MARVTERRFLKGEVQSLRARLGEELTVNELVGTPQPMQRVKEIIGKVATTDSPVLIEGESGTGKELVAAAIHRLSNRNKGPFIPVNCSAIPEDLLESEFFGHVRGAFSGAVSDALGLSAAPTTARSSWTIAELSPGLQVKLLRVLQEMQVRPVGSTKAHPVDVRVIAATNRDLDRSIADGRFRQDLYYRLNVVRVSLPQLRTRREDIPALVNHFLRRYNRRFRRDVKGSLPTPSPRSAGTTSPAMCASSRTSSSGPSRWGRASRLPWLICPLGTGSASTVAAPQSGTVPRLADVEKDLILRALAFTRTTRRRQPVLWGSLAARSTVD